MPKEEEEEGEEEEISFFSSLIATKEEEKEEIWWRPELAQGRVIVAGDGIGWYRQSYRVPCYVDTSCL